MMTTVAALFGTLPIALGYGEGADARQPLGLAVVGGLVVSQFLTLYITPVIYLYLEKLQELAARQGSGSQSRRSSRSEFTRGRIKRTLYGPSCPESPEGIQGCRCRRWSRSGGQLPASASDFWVRTAQARQPPSRSARDSRLPIRATSSFSGCAGRQTRSG